MACCLLNSVAWYGATSSSDCCSCRTVSVANLFLGSIASPVLEHSRWPARLPPGTPGRRMSSPCRSWTIARRVPARSAPRRGGQALRQNHVRMHARAPDRHTRSSPWRCRRPMRAAAIRCRSRRAWTPANKPRHPPPHTMVRLRDCHTGKASEWRELRARWSMFAAHPWSLINDHRDRPGSRRRLVSTASHGSARGEVVPSAAASGLRCAPYRRTKRSRAAARWRGGMQDRGESLVQRRRSARGDHPRVRPRVQLFLQPRTSERIRRARDLFAYFGRTERDRRLCRTRSTPRVGSPSGTAAGLHDPALPSVSTPDPEHRMNSLAAIVRVIVDSKILERADGIRTPGIAGRDSAHAGEASS